MSAILVQAIRRRVADGLILHPMELAQLVAAFAERRPWRSI